MSSQLQTNLLEIKDDIEEMNMYAEAILYHTDIKPYIELEYIESTGTQYINTNYKHTLNKTRVVADLDLLSGQSAAWLDLFGSWGGPRSEQRMFGIEANNSSASECGCYYGNQEWGVGDIRGRRIYDLNKNVWKIGSNTKTFTSVSNTSNYNMNIFTTTGYNGSIPSSRIKMKLYSFKIYEDDVLIKDMIPVKRKSDNTICMYDKVNEQFYLNAGTGTFVAGPEV